MPSYDYRCSRCGHTAELILPISSSAAPRRCPQCSVRQFRRLIVAGAQVNPGNRVQYPLVDFQLPPDPKTGRSRVVNSIHEHRDLAKKHGLAMNQVMTRDLYPT
jgi:putative FmdB family regulatory protein